jgi:hypothetical protein
MKFYKTIFFLLLFIVNINAQKKLTGKVVDHNNNPVVNAKIYLDSLDSKVETNRDGNFEVLLPEKLIDITIKSKKYGLLSSKFYVFRNCKTKKK